MSKSKWPGRQIGDDSLDGGFAKALPIYTPEQVSNYLIKGYWKDYNHWGPRGWTDTSITYDVSALSAERQVLAKMAFAAWGEICGLDFTELTGGGTAQIRFQMGDAAPSGESTAYETDDAFSGKVITDAVIHIADNFNSDTDINSISLETFIHELGHALGLGHAGNYNGTGGTGPHYQNDTRQMSIMSYVAQGNYGGASSLAVLTPQMADIYSVIRKYGEADIREGDTTYGFNASGLTSATGFVYDFDNFGPAQEDGFYGIAPAITIVDTGGIDTLDLSGFFYEQRIDLRGGKFSDAGQFKGNIGIYLTSVIENAIGGSDNDKITGNKVGNRLDGGEGEDTLYGMQGKDFLTGGADADIFKYARKGSIDHITDFEDTIDHIDLGSMDFKRFSQVNKLASDHGDDMWISFGKGDRLIIDDFSKTDFDKLDVLL